ncbi:MAG: CheW domain-containing protein [Betaproteobacteria bacterium]|nr:CheW domain-containing protein [Betaproteobacteria bacterium]
MMPDLPPAPPLPNSPREKEILRRRAQRLACEPERQREAARGELFLAVRLGASERYGIPYRHLDEIMRPRGITPVPCTPPHVAGVISRHGVLIAVLALKQLFQVEPSDGSGESRIVVVHAHGITLGLLVDEVIGNDRFVPGSLGPALPSPGVHKLEFVAGIHAGEVTMIDIEAVLGNISAGSPHAGNAPTGEKERI